MTRIDVLSSLQRHKLAATLIAVSTLTVGVALSMMYRPVYTATSVVDVPPALRPATLTDQDQQKPYPEYLDDQIHSISSDRILGKAVQTMKPPVWLRPGESLESSVARLRGSLQVKRDPQSYHQVQITLSGSTPAHLAETVDAVTNAYLDEVVNDESSARQERLNSLRQARARVRKNLASTLEEQAHFAQAAAGSVMHSSKTESLHAGSSHVPIAATKANTGEPAPTDQALLELKSSLTLKRDLLHDQIALMAPDHPLTQAKAEELAQTEAALQATQIRLHNQAADGTERTPTRDLPGATAAAPALPRSARRAAHSEATALRRQALRLEIAALRERYATLGKAIRDVEMESNPSGSVNLASAAAIPTSTLPSYTRLILPLLLPFTLLTMVAGVVLIDLVDDRVHSRNDVEKVLGFAPMGALFNDRDVTTEIFHRSSLRLATGIDQLARTSGVRTIVLTPATVGGASIAKPLGNMLARLGRNTLSIDSSGATPPVVYVPFDLNHSAHREIGGRSFSRTNGDIGSTAVIAQPFAPSVTPLTNFLKDAFQGPATNYDLVLVDAGPILSVPETEHMARFADVTVLVAEAGHTTKAQLVRASRLLQQLQIRGMATILNKIAFSRADRAMQEDERDQRRDRKWRTRNTG